MKKRIRIRDPRTGAADSLPHSPPAIGGWYWDEKAQHKRFLMPPYPGVDDCVRVNGRWAYRSLAERDERAGKQEDQSDGS